MNKPHIGIIYQETLSKEIFHNFITTVSTKNLDLQIESREATPYAMAYEWLIPTAIITYISKAYFDAFLKEMGKDHYNLLKKGLLSLQDSLFGDNAPKIRIITSTNAPNKNKKNPYSLLFSIIADAKDNKHFKLLIEDNISADEYQRTINLFLIFLNEYHSDTLSSESRLELEKQKAIQGAFFLSYSKKTDKLEFLDIFES